MWFVIPGLTRNPVFFWIPAFAGMTTYEDNIVSKKKDTGLIQDEPLIFEQGGEGRKGYSLPKWDVERVEDEKRIPSHLLRK